jgi:hypothetical protein
MINNKNRCKNRIFKCNEYITIIATTPMEHFIRLQIPKLKLFCRYNVPIRIFLNKILVSGSCP